MRKLKMGMVGGGSGALIGAVHRAAALMDGKIEFAAGAPSSTEEKALASGRDLGLPDNRNYGSWQQMLEAELGLPEEERIDFVSIVTPNHLHFPVAHAFAEAGFNVVLDKPMVHHTEQAERLVETVEKTGSSSR
jgi:predicted dehydrogenase